MIKLIVFVAAYLTVTSANPQLTPVAMYRLKTISNKSQNVTEQPSTDLGDQPQTRYLDNFSEQSINSTKRKHKSVKKTVVVQKIETLYSGHLEENPNGYTLSNPNDNQRQRPEEFLDLAGVNTANKFDLAGSSRQSSSYTSKQTQAAYAGASMNSRPNYVYQDQSQNNLIDSSNQQPFPVGAYGSSKPTYQDQYQKDYIVLTPTVYSGRLVDYNSKNPEAIYAGSSMNGATNGIYEGQSQKDMQGLYGGYNSVSGNQQKVSSPYSASGMYSEYPNRIYQDQSHKDLQNINGINSQVSGNQFLSEPLRQPYSSGGMYPGSNYIYRDQPQRDTFAIRGVSNVGGSNPHTLSGQSNTFLSMPLESEVSMNEPRHQSYQDQSQINRQAINGVETAGSDGSHIYSGQPKAYDPTGLENHQPGSSSTGDVTVVQGEKNHLEYRGNQETTTTEKSKTTTEKHRELGPLGKITASIFEVPSTILNVVGDLFNLN